MRKGKEVRKGLGGTRRISPLQRILSALHLFQDVVFPLRRESHTPSLLLRTPSRPFPPRPLPRLPLSPPVPRCPPQLPLTPPRIEQEEPFTLCGSEMVNWRFLSRLSPSYDVLRTLYLSEYQLPETKRPDKSIIHLKG